MNKVLKFVFLNLDFLNSYKNIFFLIKIFYGLERYNEALFLSLKNIPQLAAQNLSYGNPTEIGH